MTTAREWSLQAPERLLRLLDRMKHHVRVRWESADYDASGDDGRIETPSLLQAEANGSLVPYETTVRFGQPTEYRYAGHDDPDRRMHVLAVDIDVAAWLIPSSTEGHSHLYADIVCSQPDLWEWLDASVKIGLLEEGYVNACKSRGMTSLRSPWIEKGNEVQDEEVATEQVVFGVNIDGFNERVRQMTESLARLRPAVSTPLDPRDTTQWTPEQRSWLHGCATTGHVPNGNTPCDWCQSNRPLPPVQGHRYPHDMRTALHSRHLQGLPIYIPCCVVCGFVPPPVPATPDQADDEW